MPGRHPKVVSGSPVMRIPRFVPSALDVWELLRGRPTRSAGWSPERPAEAEKNYRVVALRSLRSSWTRRLAEGKGFTPPKNGFSGTRPRGNSSVSQGPRIVVHNCTEACVPGLSAGLPGACGASWKRTRHCGSTTRRRHVEAFWQRARCSRAVYQAVRRRVPSTVAARSRALAAPSIDLAMSQAAPRGACEATWQRATWSGCMPSTHSWRMLRRSRAVAQAVRPAPATWQLPHLHGSSVLTSPARSLLQPSGSVPRGWTAQSSHTVLADAPPLEGGGPGSATRCLEHSGGPTPALWQRPRHKCPRQPQGACEPTWQRST